MAPPIVTSVANGFRSNVDMSVKHAGFCCGEIDEFGEVVQGCGVTSCEAEVCVQASRYSPLGFQSNLECSANRATFSNKPSDGASQEPRRSLVAFGGQWLGDSCIACC